MRGGEFMHFFKRILASFMLIAMLSVQADTVSGNSLAQIFNEINYTLTVEWDQQDQEFYRTQVDQFQAKVLELQKEQGISNQQLIDYAVNSVKDAKLASDLKGLFGVIEANKLNYDEARKLVVDTIGKSYSQGASWTSDAALVGFGVLLLAIVIVAAIAAPARPVHYGGGCWNEYVCYDYYDHWGWYWYSDCFWTTFCY